MRALTWAWLAGVVVAAAGCGSDPAPPKVDAAAEAEDERIIKEAGDHERKARQAREKADAEANRD